MQDKQPHHLDFIKLGATVLCEQGAVIPMRAHRDDGGAMRGEVMLCALLETDAYRGDILLGNAGNRAEACIYQVVSTSVECDDLHAGDFVIPMSGAMEVLDFDSEDGGKYYICRRRFIRAFVDADIARAIKVPEPDEFEAPGIHRLAKMIPGFKEAQE